MTLELVLGATAGAALGLAACCAIGCWRLYRANTVLLREKADLAEMLEFRSAELRTWAERHSWDVNAKKIPAVDDATAVINKPELRLVRGGRQA